MISLKEVLLAEESITENPDKFLREAEMLMMKRVLPALEDLEKACAVIEKRIGNAMFPGFKAAMHDAIKASIAKRRNKVLDTDTIEREMVDYFKR